MNLIHKPPKSPNDPSFDIFHPAQNMQNDGVIYHDMHDIFILHTLQKNVWNCPRTRPPHVAHLNWPMHHPAHFPLVQPLVHKHTHTYAHIHLHHMLYMPYISSIAIDAILYWSQSKMLKWEKRCVKTVVT